MSTRLLLDGDDLASLMVRVKSEMGPGARIVRAERIRTGGIAGFFAKEHYELTVEVPDPPRPRLGRPGTTRTTAAPGSRPAPGTPGTQGTPGASPAGLDHLLATADAVEQADAGQGPAAGSSSRAVTPSPPTVDREPTVLEAQASVVDDPVPVSTATASFAEVLDQMRQMVGGEALPAEEDVVVLTTEAAVVRGEAAVRADGDVLEEPRAAAGPGTSARPRAELSPVLPADPERTDRHEGVSGATAAALLALGIPARLLTYTYPNASAPLSVLVRRFERPPAVDLRPGSVVAVVGPGDLALRTATQMAQRAGVDPTEVVLAGEVESVSGHGRRLQTPAAVAKVRSRAGRNVPTVVAIGVHDGDAGWRAAAGLLEALEPDQAWAAVDGRRRAVDLRRWLHAVGERRPFDALAASRVFEAQSPGVVLDLGVPVGWVDGLPATPVVWAAALSERLADDARWD